MQYYSIRLSLGPSSQLIALCGITDVCISDILEQSADISRQIDRFDVLNKTAVCVSMFKTYEQKSRSFSRGSCEISIEFLGVQYVSLFDASQISLIYFNYLMQKITFLCIFFSKVKKDLFCLLVDIISMLIFAYFSLQAQIILHQHGYLVMNHCGRPQVLHLTIEIIISGDIV